MKSENKDSISLNEIIFIIKDYIYEIKVRWVVILFSLLIFLPYFIYKSLNTETEYEAELTFMINDDDSGGFGSGLGSILGGFGLGGVSGSANMDKILTLLKSRRITDEAILKRVTVNDTLDRLGNHIINYLDSNNRWYHLKWYQKFYSEESELKNYRISNSDSIVYTKKLNTTLNRLHAYLMGQSGRGGIVNSEYGELDLVFGISLRLFSDELAKETITTLYNTLSSYYVLQATEKQSYTYNILEFKADSIYTELRAVEYQLAKFKDSNNGVWAKTDNLQETRLNREVQKLQLMYGELIKNKEIADFTLRNSTPFIQMLDAPRLPLRSFGSSLLSSIIKAIVFAMLLSVGFIVLMKFYKDIVN